MVAHIIPCHRRFQGHNLFRNKRRLVSKHQIDTLIGSLLAYCVFPHESCTASVRYPATIQTLPPISINS